MSKRVLITAFEPFGGEPINAAWEVVRNLDVSGIADVELTRRQLPTVFGGARDALRLALDETQPDIVVCVGEAGGRSAVSIERVAVNLDDARIPDNAGNQPRDAAAVENGPDAYFSRLPVRRLVERLQSAGIPAELSMSAGTYVCNHVMYHLLHFLANGVGRGSATVAGFIHIPYLPSQAARNRNAPSLSLETLQQAFALIVAELAGETKGE